MYAKYRVVESLCGDRMNAGQQLKVIAVTPFKLDMVRVSAEEIEFYVGIYSLYSYKHQE